ncbi:uncharacterized protein K02A2.6-like [Macrosteles quadrilineatus]|uniref:uncharacterized protein K02A2.6-like n=1 Tax=Macrosteles quadrilineatus TaxID=74068 RepID=UPI0023E1A63D|nr:uncharacterized protein K02A2.6-like [Macrosteles quadrilineatus]
MDWADINLADTNTSEEPDKLLTTFQDIFKAEIGKINSEQGHIQLKEGAKPIFVKPRQVPYALRKAVEDELHRLESSGIISKVENSQWGTPIVPVKKPNGSVRLCADYKVTANKLILDEKYSIPRIDDIFTHMNKGKFFCTLDISNAYLHLPMDEESREIQTISTHLGLFKVNRLMFGIKVAPSIWQLFMDKVLHGLEGTVCFFDDILIQGSTFQETMSRLKEVFQRIRQYNLRLNQDKCKFFKKSVKYLGHVIDENGLHKSPDNVEAIRKAKRPEDVTQLRSFLGLTNYYTRFVPNMSTYLEPLNNVLRHGKKFTWNKECEDAFVKIKAEITSERILAHYDLSEALYAYKRHPVVVIFI